MKSVLKALPILLIPMGAIAEVSESRLSIFLGAKTMDDSAWNDFDQQAEISFAADINLGYIPVNLYIGASGSLDKKESGSDEGKTREYLLGVSKHFSLSSAPISWYTTGGLAHIEGKISSGSLTHSDFTTGFFVGSGIVWNFSSNYDFGLEARYSKAEVELDGKGVEAGGKHIGVTAGYRW